MNVARYRSELSKRGNSPHQLTENVKLLQKAALLHNNKVLLLKRSSNATSRPDCWDLPGGNSEWPSRTDNASNLHTADIIREVKEETGVQLTADAFGLSNISLMRTFFEAERQVYSVILGWKIMISSKPSVILSHEHTAFEWVTIGAIDQYDFGGSKGDWLKEVVVESRAISR